MDIIVKGRHTDVNERFRRHVDTKIAKVEKLDPKVIRIDVEVSQERNPRQSDRRERVELTTHSRGPVIRAEAAADDRYAALDIALTKLESRLRRLSDRRKARHNGRGQARPAVAPSASDAEPAEAAAGGSPADTTASPVEPTEENLIPIPAEGGPPLVLKEKFHSADPMTIDQALFEMELVGHDFYLFRDRDSGHPSVVYRRRGWEYGVLRLVEN